MNSTTIATALVLLSITTAVAAAGGDGEDAGVLGPVNVFDYLVYDDQIERTSSRQFLRKSWLPNQTILPDTTHQYFELLKTVKRDLDQDVIPLSFRIEPSLQDIAPFFSAHGLPIGEGFNDSRNLFLLRDGEVKFAPTEPGFLDTIRYLRALWAEHVLDENIETGKAIAIDRVFGITNPHLVSEQPSTNAVQSFIWKADRTDSGPRPYLIVPPNFELPQHSTWSKFSIPDDWTFVDQLSSDPTNPVKTTAHGAFDQELANRYLAAFNFSGWQTKTEEEQLLVPFIDELVTESVTRWITQGGVDSDWDQFQRDLENLGISTLIQLWQSNVDSARDALR